MANNGDDQKKLVPDPDDEEAKRQWEFYRSARPGAAAAPTVPPARDTTLPSPETVLNPPQTMPTTRQPTPLRSELESELQYYKGRAYPEKKTGWGRVGQVLGDVGQDIGMAVAPEVMLNIPGTKAWNLAELHRVQRELGQEETREGLGEARAAQTEKEKAETEEAGVRTQAQRATLGRWEQVPGSEGYDPNTMLPVVKWRAPWGEVRLGPVEGTGPGGGPMSGMMPVVQQTAPAPPSPTPGAAPPPLGMTPPVTPTPTPQGPRYVPGKPPETSRRLTDEEKAQEQKELDRMFQAQYGAGKTDPAYQLGPNATVGDVARIAGNLKAEEATAGRKATLEATEQQRRTANELARSNELLKQQEAARQAEVENSQWVRAVSREDPPKIYWMTRGSYKQHPQDFNPYPGAIQPTEVTKMTDGDLKRLNEMQGAMNSFANAAQDYSFDAKQNQIVIQALQEVNKSYVDDIIGIPALNYVATNLKKLGLEGANPQTREYIVNLIALREAMLGLPKEVTEGSRMVDPAIKALWSALPGGTTPDKDYAFRQLYRAQGILDRVRGTTVPIIEGARIINKIPELYQYKRVLRDGTPAFSDDNKNWVDERGNPVRK